MNKKLLIASLVLISTTFFAQEKESNIDEVSIQGKFLSIPIKKINENIEIITRNEIENSPAKSIDDLLHEVTGLDIRSRGANGVQSDVSIRGSSFEQVLILINGIRMNDSQTGHNSLNIPVDLSNVERIEIVKGAAATRFGNNGYAGVINIVTKISPEKSAKISAMGGDFATYNLGLGVNLGNEKFSNFFQINRGGSEGYHYNTDYKIDNIYYQNQLKIKNGNIGFQAGFSDKKYGANGFYASPLAKDQYEETQASIVSVNHEQNFRKFAINSNIYWRRGQDMYIYIRNKPSIYRNMHIGNNIGGELNGTYKSSLGVTGFGVELRDEILVSNNLGNRERFVTQLYLEHHFSLINNKLQISPGISWANYTTEGNFFYPGLDAGFDLDKNNKIYGNLAKVHRVPTFTDLYYKSFTEQGNPNLVPENALSAELGYRFQNRNILAKFSGFIRNSSNSIDWLKATPSSIWTAQNVGDINMKGIEAEFKQKLTDWQKYSLGYTYLDNRYANANTLSRYALDNLKHQFIAKAETKIFRNFTNELVYRYNERANMGSYNLLDDKLSYELKNINFYILINNITNTIYYETQVIMPKRWFQVGFTYKIGL